MNPKHLILFTLALLAGCAQHVVKAVDLTPAGQPGIVIDSMRFTETTWEPVAGPSVEGYVVVHNSSQEKLNQEIACEGRPHQQQLIVWENERTAYLGPGQSVELWFFDFSTRTGLLDITCRVQPFGNIQ